MFLLRKFLRSELLAPVLYLKSCELLNCYAQVNSYSFGNFVYTIDEIPTPLEFNTGRIVGAVVMLFIFVFFKNTYLGITKLISNIDIFYKFICKSIK